MNWQDMRAVARSFAYGLFECSPFINQLMHPNNTDTDIEHLVTSMFRNQVSEFWHCLNRKFYVEGLDVGLRIVHNSDVDRAIANTLAWLKWYQRGGHKQNDETPDEERIPMPEWMGEYV
jgi:hypothetical protein